MATTIAAPLAGKVAIVTGGSRGIGASIARKLAEQGCTHITITYTSRKDGAEATMADIRKINASIKTIAIKADLLEPGFTDKVVKSTLEDLLVDHIDILVFNAAIMGAGEPKAHWDQCMLGNAWVSWELAEAVITYMPQGGRVILISSVASRIPMSKTMIPYAASKAAIESVSRNLAMHYGAPKGITVNAISVGATNTDSLKALSGDSMEGMDKDGFQQFVSALSTLHRIGEPDEVADIVAFVASPAAGWINGNQIPANGGIMSMAQS